MKLLTASQIKSAELLADAGGLSGFDLMQNAGSAAADFIAAAHAPGKIVILSGSGNNGGDGLLVATHLKAKGFAVTVILTDGIKADTAKIAFSVAETAELDFLDFKTDAETCAVAICKADILVDAMFGIGFHTQMSENEARLIGFCQTAHAFKYALDIASGCFADTGEADKNAFTADVTLTFSCFKPAHFIMPATKKCGRVVLLEIGMESIAEGLESNISLVDEACIKDIFPPIEADTYKNQQGRLLILAGQPGMAGAAKLAAEAATRSGAGLVELMTDKRIAGTIMSGLTLQLTDYFATDTKDLLAYGEIGPAECERIVRKAQKANAVVIGCGLGSGKDRARLIEALIENTQIPILIDADGLNSLSGYLHILSKGANRLLLTPHIGEFSRLCGLEPEEILRRKMETVREFCTTYGVSLLLKGADTIICDGQRVNVVTAGSPGMAKGGSGDVLSGVGGAFLARGVAPFEAASIAAWCCGKAGETAAQAYSVTAATPLDTIAMLGSVYKQVEKIR